MTAPSNFYIFVYGSLRSGFNSPAYEYISRYFDLVTTAKVRGRLYDMGEYPAAIPTTEDHFILGELYLVKARSEFSWAIAQLDDYEGVLVEQGVVQLYRRELTDVIAGDEQVPAWIYWYNQSVEGKPAIESGDILDYLNSKKG